MSGTIPEAILAEARDIVSDIDADFTYDGQTSRGPGEREAAALIAQAILSAEKRGAERERSRCAEIAEGADRNVMWTPAEIASAIRKGAS